MIRIAFYDQMVGFGMFYPLFMALAWGNPLVCFVCGVRDRGAVHMRMAWSLLDWIVLRGLFLFVHLTIPMEGAVRRVVMIH